MSSKAALRMDAVPAPPPTPKTRLRVVDGRCGKPTSASRTDWTRPSPARLPDPLEEPVTGFCGLCGNKIEGRAIEEVRVSGANQKRQDWEYHELCWRQLERMRRMDEPEHFLRKSVNPDLRYSVRGRDSAGLSSPEGFSNLAG